jgi:hypothetical protein
MSLITFSYKDPKSTQALIVNINCRQVGEIKAVPFDDKKMGWQYFPKSDSKHGGEIFTSLRDCKRSLLEG